MRETETKLTIPSRRRALRFSLAALMAGAAGPAGVFNSARAMPGADAELIALCAVVVEKEAARQALHALRHTIADEQRTEPAMQALYDESEQAMCTLMALPGPSTVAGLQAMAWASIVVAPHDLEGEIIHPGDAEWLAFRVVTFLANEPELIKVLRFG
jgi:hypothetical protein